MLYLGVIGKVFTVVSVGVFIAIRNDMVYNLIPALVN